jgi:hypothetical protein
MKWNVDAHLRVARYTEPCTLLIAQLAYVHGAKVSPPRTATGIVLQGSPMTHSVLPARRHQVLRAGRPIGTLRFHAGLFSGETSIPSKGTRQYS